VSINYIEVKVPASSLVKWGNYMVLVKENRRLLTYSRLASLSYLDYYGKDGVMYKELKNALGLSDSQLGPQLLWLKEKGYVKTEPQKLDEKELSVYYITEKGKIAYKSIVDWIKTIPIYDNLK
jgi:DNA-binding MarR family transcriptional regulator